MPAERKSTFASQPTAQARPEDKLKNCYFLVVERTSLKDDVVLQVVANEVLTNEAS